MPEEKYMRRAIELAKKGSGHVNPNPLVGAVIVKDGEIIGEGYHECYGQLHAERNAIANARKRGNNMKYHLCNVRALLPLRKDTSLYRSNY